MSILKGNLIAILAVLLSACGSGGSQSTGQSAEQPFNDKWGDMVWDKDQWG